MTARGLLRALDALPDEAQVPVGWVREQIHADDGWLDELLNQTEAADYAGKSTATIRRWEREGKVRNYGIEHAPLYKRRELLNGAPPDAWEARLIDARA